MRSTTAIASPVTEPVATDLAVHAPGAAGSSRHRRHLRQVPMVRFAVLEVFDAGWEPLYCLDTPDA